MSSHHATGIIDQYRRAAQFMWQQASSVAIILILFELVPYFTMLQIMTHSEVAPLLKARLMGEDISELLASDAVRRELLIIVLVGYVGYLLRITANSALVLHSTRQTNGTALAAIIFAFQQFPRTLIGHLRIMLHIALGLLLIIPGVERFFGTRIALCELWFNPQPAGEAIRQAESMSNGWRWYIANLWGMFLLANYGFMIIWPFLTQMLGGAQSLLWIGLGAFLYGILKFSLQSCYVLCWIEAASGVKPAPYGMKNQ